MLGILLAILMGCQVYPKTAFVVDVDRNLNIVTAMDVNGYKWQFTDCDDWQIGDGVSMIVSDNGTEIVTDDVVLSVRYSSIA